jgi:hypothetical protein
VHGARVFEHTFVHTISVSDGKALIDKLKNYPCLNNTDIIDGLKASFKFVKEDANKVPASEVDVLQWHFALNGQFIEKANNDTMLRHCRNCKKGMACCDCGIEHVGLWWDVFVSCTCTSIVCSG